MLSVTILIHTSVKLVTLPIPFIAGVCVILIHTSVKLVTMAPEIFELPYQF